MYIEEMVWLALVKLFYLENMIKMAQHFISLLFLW